MEATVHQILVTLPRQKNLYDKQRQIPLLVFKLNPDSSGITAAYRGPRGRQVVGQKHEDLRPCYTLLRKQGLSRFLLNFYQDTQSLYDQKHEARNHTVKITGV